LKRIEKKKKKFRQIVADEEAEEVEAKGN